MNLESVEEDVHDGDMRNSECGNGREVEVDLDPAADNETLTMRRYMCTSVEVCKEIVVYHEV